MENKIKHLEMIENIIQRMASNSFQLKGWAVTLVVLIGSFSATGTDKRFMLLAFVPLIAFWCLDAFYLQQERKYRVVYNIVRDKAEEQIDFSMDTSKIVAEVNDLKKICYCNALFSKTEAMFYIPIIIAVGILTIVLIF